jgi:hypothetical protein
MRSLSLVPLLACLAGAWTTPSGGLRASNVSDLLLTKRDTRYYNEAWSYQFLFGNGMQATLNLTYAKLGFKAPVCGADLSLAGFKGRSYMVGREYPEERFQQSASPFRLAVNQNIWMAGLPPAAHHLHFAANKNEGYFVDLEFTEMKPGVVWGDGRFTGGDGDFSAALPIPMARVSGRIAVGSDTVRVSGVAMMEHLRQSHLVSDLMTGSLRYFQPGPKPLCMNWVHVKGEGWLSFGVSWATGRPMLLTGTASVDGQAPPAAAVLNAGGSAYRFERRNLVQSNSVLDGMEGITRWVVKKFVGNVRMYRGKADVNGQPGIYQFMQVTD